MNKSYIRLAIFLVLMLALSLGLSYTSLNHVSEGKVDREDSTMSIALVNEDEGTRFNQEELDFGDAFVQSIDKNNDHEWYVVSRGVAESGLERNTYDMMIVIPNDFSQKALSINSESPEQVVLDYKINASDSESVQAQAEETASSILNEFNRRIIDVYFASVIGNLQEAQDNVTEIVEEDAALTYTYNNAIHNPLSSYTDQFSTVKDYTETSKDSFSGLEDTLDSFEERLTERVDSGEDYQSSVQDTVELKESNNVLDLEFLEQLNAYNESLRTDDVDAQLQQLQAMNQYINAQFELREDVVNGDYGNIAINTAKVRAGLDDSLKFVEDIQNRVDIENEEIKDHLSGIIEEAFEGNGETKFLGERNLTELLETQHDEVQLKIEEQISRLPLMDKERIDNTDLSPEMTREIQNVIEVTNKYNDEFEQVAYRIRDESILPDIKRLKDHLQDNGIVMTDTVELPESEEPEGIFRVYDIPKGFTIDHLSVQLPNGESVPYPNYEEDTKVPLPSYQQGKFTVNLRLKLIDENTDIYEPKKWKWEIKLKDKEIINDEDESGGYASTEIPNAPLVATATIEGLESENGGQQQSQDETQKEQSENEAGSDAESDASENGDGNHQGNTESDESGNSDNENENSQETGDDGDSGDITNPEENGGSDGEGDEEPGEEPEVKKVKIKNHHIRHKVMDPVIDKSTKDLLRAAENTIAPYQKLLSLYEAYFGISLTCEDIDGDCGSVGSDNLGDMATNDSLYALFNNNVGDLLTNHVVSHVTGVVMEQISTPLTDLKTQIANHQNLINETSQNADDLLQTVAETREAASTLNDSLEQTLNNIQDWREQSLSMLESQTDIQANNEEEQRAVMALGEEFQPLLTQSQSLAERASNNLNQAETVYQTFDQIDNQADSIQQSGTTLVQQAEELSVDMTDQLLDDQEFADNFADVLANSRIGERQNEDLYDFLSHPVDAKNDGVIIERDTFTPYFLVLTCFIVALFTAYVISTANQRRMADDQFEKESSLIGANSLITGITAGIGVLEGLAIGLASAYFLNVAGGSLVLWTGLMILIMLTMVLVSAYLLRQLKMIGMFILLAVMSMYLFLTNALESSLTGFGQLNAFSPLQYVETLLARAMQGDSNYQLIMFSMIGIALLAALGNLLVVKRFGRKKTEDDEDVA